MSAFVETNKQLFWRRQFAPEATGGQIVFDLAFGVALPLVCMLLDPIVFRASFGQPIIPNHALLAFFAIGIGVISLPTWLIAARLPALFAGLLTGGSIFALVLGVRILPFSFVGLIFGIGVLGFVPFVTAWVFARNAIRAYWIARLGAGAGPVLATATLGFLIASGGPLAGDWYVTREVSRATEMVLKGDPAQVIQGVGTLKRLKWLANFDSMVFAYEAEEHPERRARLAASYKELTGSEIERRHAVLTD